jgi:hypothetical protein
VVRGGAEKRRRRRLEGPTKIVDRSAVRAELFLAPVDEETGDRILVEPQTTTSRLANVRDPVSLEPRQRPLRETLEARADPRGVVLVPQAPLE